MKEKCDYPVEETGKLGGITYRCRVQPGVTAGKKYEFNCLGGIVKNECAKLWNEYLGSPQTSSPGPHIAPEPGHVGTDTGTLFEDTRFNT